MKAIPKTLFSAVIICQIYLNVVTVFISNSPAYRAGIMPVVRLAHALSKTGELRIQQRDNSILSFSFYFLFERGRLLFYDNLPSLS